MGNASGSAAEVAAALRQRLPRIGSKKLHKLLYYCQGHHLAMRGAPIFNETVSAWDMGPVVGSLWKTERDHGPSISSNPLDEDRLNTIGYVVSRYGRLTGRDLENLTHAESPWRRADENRPPSGSVRIERDWLLEYFTSEPADDDEDHMVLDSEEALAFLAGARSRLAEPLHEDPAESLRARMRDAS